MSMKARLFKRDGLWHYRCPCCPDVQPDPHWSYGVMLRAAHAHIDGRHWRQPQLCQCWRVDETHFHTDGKIVFD